MDSDQVYWDVLSLTQWLIVHGDGRLKASKWENTFKFIKVGWDQDFAKVWINQYSPKSAACVRIWGEVYYSKAWTNVSLPRTYSNSKSCTGLPTPPWWCYPSGIGWWVQVQSHINVLTAHWPSWVFDPGPWTTPCLPHHYQLSRPPCLTAMHCDQPQIKRGLLRKKGLATY